MTNDMRAPHRLLRPIAALTLAFIACTPTMPPDDAGARRETCEAACARREAAHCIEAALAPACVPTCLRLRAAGIAPVERCRP